MLCNKHNILVCVDLLSWIALLKGKITEFHQQQRNSHLEVLKLIVQIFA